MIGNECEDVPLATVSGLGDIDTSEPWGQLDQEKGDVVEAPVKKKLGLSHTTKECGREDPHQPGRTAPQNRELPKTAVLAIKRVPAVHPRAQPQPELPPG